MATQRATVAPHHAHAIAKVYSRTRRLESMIEKTSSNALPKIVGQEWPTRSTEIMNEKDESEHPQPPPSTNPRHSTNKPTIRNQHPHRLRIARVHRRHAHVDEAGREVRLSRKERCRNAI